MTTQHITQDQAVELARAVPMIYWVTPEITALCNAAIQHYLAEQAKEFPVLPEPSMSKQVNAFTGEVMTVSYFSGGQLQAYGQQCAAHAREVALEEAALMCNDFDMCDPAYIAEGIRLKKAGK